MRINWGDTERPVRPCFNRGFCLLKAAAICVAAASAHPLTFNSTVTYGSSPPAGGAASISNWSGAAFDAANIGGSGVNADGGANNGGANDASTYVANNQPRQGQSYTTGSHPNGYDLTAITARMAGYTNNTASGASQVAWDLHAHNGPVIVEIGKVDGTTFSTVLKQNFIMGGEGSPGAGSSVNGAGTYITFNLPSPVHLEPDTTYAFDFTIGNGSGNYFEWLGIAADPYAGGSAYNRDGATLTPLAGDRVFQLHLTAPAVSPAGFAHPGTLHTQVDLDRMTAKIAANAEPWKASYDILANSPWAQTWWPAYNIDYIVRGDSGNNYTRSQQDAQAIYELALRWKLTGDVTYANKAVEIANVWSDLQGLGGNSNVSLASGICGYLFAIGGEVLSTYPGWPAAEKQAYKDMMMRVFYPANHDFLWRHHQTPFTKGGNTHYRLNWDTANMASMAAIGILCDNRAVYQQAVDHFKYGSGNGRIERAAWYLHPGGLAQTEESGRDQPHNNGGWHAMALLCQMAWNQGDDLFGYDNNRVLRAFEYNAKYNLGNDVPWVFHRNASLTYTETLSGAGRGSFVPIYELIYNHYVNVKGIAAPWSKQVADMMRPEDRPHVEYHPSQVDWFGLGGLTYARDAIASGAAPGGLGATWSKNRVVLDWWGSATATSYLVKRATSPGGPYTTLGTVTGPDLTFTDTGVVNGASYHYLVTATTPSGDLDSVPLAVSQAGVTLYPFDGSADDAIGTRHGTLKGGPTGLPSYASGKTGQAITFDGVDDYLQLPVGTGNYQDITVSAWVYWNGGNAWQRIFDFGSEIEKYFMLTPRSGSNTLRFQMTTSRTTDGTLTLDGPLMPTATWTHVAVTLNGDTATLYVNGVPVDSDTAALDPLFGQPFCYLGKSMWNGDPLFSGRIDDFRIYNHALSGSDVYTLWGQSSNSPPVFGTDPVTKPAATEDAAYTGQTLAGSAADANGGTLIYSKVSGPPWLGVAANGVLTGTPANGDVGLNAFVVRVTDASGATDDATLHIAVGNTNDAPTWLADPLARPEVTRDQPYLAVSLAEDAADVDEGDTLNFSKISGPAWLNIGSDGALSGTPAAADVGTNTFTVRITDDANASDDATLRITVLPFELRSHFPLEGDTTDATGHFDGTATGVPVYTTAGRLGQALVLDGVDDHVTLSAAAADYQDITVSAWVYWNGGNPHQRVFDFGDDTASYLFLSPNSGGSLRFAIRNGGAEQQVNTTPLATGQWVHLAVTLGGDTATLYVNGSPAASNTGVTIHPGDFKPEFNYIGKSQWPDPLFNGRIDDFRIYNYPLPAAEIADMANPVPEIPSGLIAKGLNTRVALSWNAAQAADTYTVKKSLNSGGPYTIVAAGLTTPSFSDPGLANGTSYWYVVSATNEKGESADSAEAGAAPSDLLVHLKLDETGGTLAADASGNGFSGTTVNNPAWAAGRIGNSLELAAASSQHLTFPAGVMAGVNDFTVAAWVKMSSFATWARIFDFGTGTNNYMFLTSQYTGTSPNAAKLRFAIRTPSVGEQVVNSTVALTAGSWAHVAVTLSGNTATLYLNGSAVGTNAAVTLKPSTLGTTTQNYLGKSQWNDPYLNGAIDDFRIYSRSLSSGEIALFQSSLGAPQNVVASGGWERVDLSWSAVPDAAGYTVKSATESGGPYTVVASGVNALSFTHGSLPQGIARYYVVSAANFAGEGPDSAEVSATPGAQPIFDAEVRGCHISFTSLGGVPESVIATIDSSLIGHSYRLQYSADLGAGSWQDIGETQAGTGAAISFSVPLSEPGEKGFYRVVIGM
jgi:hypothetical protein